MPVTYLTLSGVNLGTLPLLGNNEMAIPNAWSAFLFLIADPIDPLTALCFTEPIESQNDNFRSDTLVSTSSPLLSFSPSSHSTPSSHVAPCTYSRLLTGALQCERYISSLFSHPYHSHRTSVAPLFARRNDERRFPYSPRFRLRAGRADERFPDTSLAK